MGRLSDLFNRHAGQKDVRKGGPIVKNAWRSSESMKAAIRIHKLSTQTQLRRNSISVRNRLVSGENRSLRTPKWLPRGSSISRAAAWFRVTEA